MSDIQSLEAELFRALSHPVRLRLLQLLADGERTVGELSALLVAESSGTSQHLSALRQAGLVESRKDGTALVYRIRDDRTTELLALARRLIRTRLVEGQELLALLAEETAGERGDS